MSKGTHEHEDDAMFTKKPLGGTSCASCQKDVVNMYGKKADFYAWNKFPFRDPSERIARVILLNTYYLFRLAKDFQKCFIC
jgi:hypothetical protein